MCGICGFTTKKGAVLSEAKQVLRSRIAKALLIANESRGTDSTGAFLLNGGQHILSKNTCASSTFIREKEVEQAFNKNNHLMLGHTRQATRGAVTKRNAHPFIVGDIVGVHNGVIMNDYAIEKEHGFKVEVDSEVIFALLNKKKNDFKTSFQEIRGSASLAWIDLNDPFILNLVAHENPLSMATVPILDTIFFSSEFSALDSILTAAVGTDLYSIWGLKEETVYTIKPNLDIDQIAVKFKEYEYTQYKGYKRNSSGDLVGGDSCEIKDNSTAKRLDDIVYKNRDIEDVLEDMANDGCLDEETLIYLRSEAEKHGCYFCHKPVGASCYYEEDEQIISCASCVDNIGNHFYTYVDLIRGTSAPMLLNSMD